MTIPALSHRTMKVTLQLLKDGHSPQWVRDYLESNFSGINRTLSHMYVSEAKYRMRTPLSESLKLMWSRLRTSMED